MNHESPDKENSQGHGEPSKRKWWKIPLFVVLYVFYIFIGYRLTMYLMYWPFSHNRGQGRGTLLGLPVVFLMIAIGVTAEWLLKPYRKPRLEKKPARRPRRNVQRRPRRNRP
jgi:hypothetical protein